MSSFKLAGGKVFIMGDVGFTSDPHCKGPNQFDMNKGP